MLSWCFHWTLRNEFSGKQLWSRWCMSLLQFLAKQLNQVSYQLPTLGHRSDTCVHPEKPCLWPDVSQEHQGLLTALKNGITRATIAQAHCTLEDPDPRQCESLDHGWPAGPHDLQSLPNWSKDQHWGLADHSLWKSFWRMRWQAVRLSCQIITKDTCHIKSTFNTNASTWNTSTTTTNFQWTIIIIHVAQIIWSWPTTAGSTTPTSWSITTPTWFSATTTWWTITTTCQSTIPTGFIPSTTTTWSSTFTRCATIINRRSTTARRCSCRNPDEPAHERSRLSNHCMIFVRFSMHGQQIWRTYLPKQECQ